VSKFYCHGEAHPNVNKNSVRGRRSGTRVASFTLSRMPSRGIDISHETVRFWWNRFGPMFAAEIAKKRVVHMRGFVQWR
jgi:hypothetical protein